MLLESIELQGYKTFAGRTRFEFAGQITCIVGPNGSGKSNIADAIRWVLGEQSYSLLRGKKTEDMIFSGSETRSRSGMASANITFDNETGWLPIDFSEVSIARRAYRDGTNEYLLNGQRVRLRDISELLSSSGLSERTYTIIGQGLVDAALALRAEDRRRLFEEAAGIGLYRSRREESRRRLEATHRNIERVEDILAELNPRLRSLKRQADRASQFEQVSADLKSLLLDYYGFHWFKIQEDLRHAREAAADQQTGYETAQQEQANLEEQLEGVREKIQGLRLKLGSWHQESAQHHLQREELARYLAVAEERARSLINQQQNTSEEIKRIENQVVTYRERIQDSDRYAKKLALDLEEAKSHVETGEQELKSLQVEQSRVESKTAKIHETIAKLTEKQQILEDRRVNRRENREQQKIALESAHEATIRADELKRKIETRVANANEIVKNLSDLCDGVKTDLENLIDVRIDKESHREEALETRLEIRSVLARLSAELVVLDEADRKGTGLGKGSQKLLQSGMEGTIPGILGALSSQIVVPPDLEPAIAATLGEYLDAVLISNKDVDQKKRDPIAEAIRLLLDLDKSGVLLPLAELKPPPAVKQPPSKGVIGLAADLVTTAPEFRTAVDVLLGRTLVVEDRFIAGEVLLDSPRIDRVVTLVGEVFHANGVISIGRKSGSSSLSRPRQKRELSDQVSTQENRMTAIDEILVTLDSEIDTLNLQVKEKNAVLKGLIQNKYDAQEEKHQIEIELDQIQREAEWLLEQENQLTLGVQGFLEEDQELTQNLIQIESKLANETASLSEILREVKEKLIIEKQESVSYWKTKVALIEAALDNARIQLEERRSAEALADGRKEDFENRLAGLSTSMDAHRDEIDGLKARETEVANLVAKFTALIDPAEEELAAEEVSQNKLEKAETKARLGMSAIYRQYSQSQLHLSRTEEQLDRYRVRIEDDLGLVSFEYDDSVSGPTPLPLYGLVESLPKLHMLPEDMEKTIKRQRAQVRRMGSINPEAQAEYKEVLERHTFLTNQVEDLRAAEQDVKQVINELESIMVNEFQKTFEQVAREFREIFKRLFGGGNARLVLTDPGDLTETGIDIEARLPGRRTQGLSLLSGGERSLTATALVFALLKVSPTPFCVLDEVDAMLDEANVGRFRDLLKELAEDTQFIVITHNRNTVQAADVIYGVTMGRDSASQMVSLKLDQVADMV